MKKNKIVILSLIILVIVVSICYYVQNKEVNKIYNNAGMFFQYPNDWTVEEDYYRTPAQEYAGEPATIVGVSIKSSGGRVIYVGGRQVNCSESTNIQKNGCIGGMPISTTNLDAGTLEVFDLVIKTFSNINN